MIDKIILWLYGLLSLSYLANLLLLNWKAFVRRQSISRRTLFLDFLIYVTLSIILLSLYLGADNDTTLIFDLADNIAQFIITVLSIFLTLSIFPVESIINNTTFTIIDRKIIKNEYFLKCLFLLIVILVASLGQKLYGINKQITYIQLYLLIISIVALLTIIYEALRLLDVRNIIFDYERDVKGDIYIAWYKINRKIKYKNAEEKKQLLALAKLALVNFVKFKIEPIFVTTKKYLQLDQYEVVLRGLTAIQNIAVIYMNLYKYQIQDNDPFLTYLIERFVDLRSAITDTSHYSITSNLVTIAKNITLKSLEIETPLSKINQSYLSLGLVSFIKEIVLSKELLKETSSAPLNGIQSIEEIGIEASNKKHFSMAHSCLGILVEISTKCTKLNFFFANQVAKNANSAITHMHLSMMINFIEGYDILYDILEDSIYDTINAYIQVGEDNPSKNNLAPYIGTGVDNLGIFDYANMSTFTTLPVLVFNLVEKNVDELHLFAYLDSILKTLNRLIMSDAGRKMSFLTKEVCESTKDICFTLFQFYYLKKIKDRKGLKNLIDNRVLFIYQNAIDSIWEGEKRWLDDNLDKWFSTVGMYLLIFEEWNGFPLESIEYLLELSKKALPSTKLTYKGVKYPNYDVLNRLENIASYLGLTLYWQFTLIKNKNIERDLVNYLVSNRELFYRTYSTNGYLPQSLGWNDYWGLSQPYLVYYTEVLNDFRILINVDAANSGSFNSYMRKYEYLWKLIELFKFKACRILQYTPIGQTKFTF